MATVKQELGQSRRQFCKGLAGLGLIGTAFLEQSEGRAQTAKTPQAPPAKTPKSPPTKPRLRLDLEMHVSSVGDIRRERGRDVDGDCGN